MLQTLLIKNVALIDCAEINFSNGLNVLSGETGAGKSVIIESLNFVLGAKADKSMIRTGESECYVRAEFFIDDIDFLADFFEQLEIECEQTLIISRKFNLDGRSTIKVNGVSVTVGMLKQLTSHLVDVHGQSEHFYLLNTSNQLKLIDKVGGKDISEIKFRIAHAFKEYKDVVSELNKLGGDETQRIMRLDILNYQINEIQACDLKENEEDELLEIKQKLNSYEKIANALNGVKNSIKDEGGVVDILSNTMRLLSNITSLGKEYSDLDERLTAVYSELDDLGDCASNLLEDFDFSEYDADKIENRLDKIKNIKKKYGSNYSEIYSFLENALAEKEKLENFNELASSLISKKEKLENDLYEKYLILSQKRKESANGFAKAVLTELVQLGMPKAKFEVNFSDFPNKSDCQFNSASGVDSIEFLFSANMGEPLKPLSMVISGGEMSRFMLSIKTQTAKYNEIKTFIFDEIDAGISGFTARVVAQKFVDVSKNVQIIAISHLPQISAMADNNLLILKQEAGEKTITTVKTLSEEEKVLEVMRLIGGENSSLTAKEHAKELITQANQYKKEKKVI
ncbi:MAG: DNA repair protein RecN [Clostridiales bacterium]|nr:DNA repair protein RecN [Clostridiales bacterium]